MKKILTLLLVPFLLMSLNSTAFATLMQWTNGVGANNHWYEVFKTDSTIGWNDANNLAETAYDGTGTLASITSAEENVFVSNLVNNGDNTWDSYGPWLGGFVDETDDSWDHGQWTTGETWDYTNWDGGQPTLATLVGQKYLHLYPSSDGTWNDSWEDGGVSRNYQGVFGYVVEWEQNPVPEPATMLLFGVGLIGLAGVNRRKK